MESLFEEYNTADIKPILQIGSYALVKYQKPIKEKKRGITNERQSVTKEIQDIIEMENGGKINSKLLAIKLAHIPTKDLYFILSQGKDYRKRTGKPFAKYVYGSIKPKLDK